MKVHVLYPPNYQSDIIRKDRRQCFESIRGVVHEKEKQEWAYHCIGVAPECSPPTWTLVVDGCAVGLVRYLASLLVGVGYQSRQTFNIKVGQLLTESQRESGFLFF